MSSIQFHKILRITSVLGATAAIAGTPVRASAQGPQGGAPVYDLTHPRPANADSSDEAGAKTQYEFKSRADSISWVRNRAIAEQSRGFRLVVSLQDRHVWAIVDDDTVLSAPAAVASGRTLEYAHRKFTFNTPRGIRTVLAKEADPIWQPPEWLYVETAEEYDLKLDHLNNNSRIKLSDGRILTMKDGEAGVLENGEFAALPTDEHIVFDNTLYIPPMGSKNRKVDGELGKYRLILGDGYLLHGTPFKESIGLAATHGCVRLRDEDIEWLYEHVPVGTKVYIY